jgi:hypothetical protein
MASQHLSHITSSLGIRRKPSVDPLSFSFEGNASAPKKSLITPKRWKTDSPNVMAALSSENWQHMTKRIRDENLTLLVVTVTEAADLKPVGAFFRADPFLRIRKDFHIQQTTTKRKDLNPVWKERCHFLVNSETVLTFEMIDASLDNRWTVASPIMGTGELRVTDELMESVKSGPQPAVVPLTLNNKPAGKVHLLLDLNKMACLNPSVISNELRDISVPEQTLTHHLEPCVRQLRVKLGRSIVSTYSTSKTADPYVKVVCGLFSASTEPQLSCLAPVWDEDFIVPVPYRSPGTNPLPKALLYNEVELQLWQWEPTGGDSQVGRVRIPFSQIPGFDGEKIDPDDPPWTEFPMQTLNLEQVKRRIHDVVTIGPSKASGDSTITAALFFDMSYWQPPTCGCGKLTIQLDMIRLKHPAPGLHVIIKSNRHWVRFPVTSGERLNRVLQGMVWCPGMVYTIAVISCKLAQRDRTLGVVHIRPASLIPNRQTPAEFQLLTRGKAKCFLHGTLHLTLCWECTCPFATAKAYLRPPLAPRYYAHPWTATQTALFAKYSLEAIMLYLDSQPNPIRSETVKDVLGDQVNKFDRAILKAHLNRSRVALAKIKVFAERLHQLLKWENYWLSFSANVAWVAFSFFPREVFTCGLIAGALYLTYLNLTTPKTARLMPMDAELFGGMARDSDEEEEDEAPVRKALNPVTILSRKIEQFEDAGVKAQTVLRVVATGFESLVSAVEFSDFMISKIVATILVVAALALWVIPFPLLLAAVGLHVLRHPRFRKPVPSAAVCLISRLPNRADTVIYAKGGKLP